MMIKQIIPFGLLQNIVQNVRQEIGNIYSGADSYKTYMYNIRYLKIFTDYVLSIKIHINTNNFNL